MFGWTTITHAQLDNTSLTNINVSLVPENPKPGDTIYVSLVSYSTDINAAKITWSINGKAQKSGVGQKTFTFTAGGMNESQTLDISIITAEGEDIEKSYTIKPSSVDLLWESSSFTPAFYKGKAMFSHQNVISFIALPHITDGSGREIGAKNLIYRWKKNGTVMDSDSGYGKNVFIMTGSLISRPLDIEVDVTSQDNLESGYARTIVNPVEPEILFYEKNPLYGIEFQKSLRGSIDLSEPEIAVIGMPLFFGTKTLYAPELKYVWKINGTPIDDDTSQTIRVFRQKEGVTGKATIGLSLENTRKILQYTSSSFDLSFGFKENPEVSL
jgi:hypothetical protein